MFRNPLSAAALSASLLAGVAAMPAAASTPLSITVPSAMPLAAVGISDVACAPAAAPAYTAPLNARAAKSAALNGGEMSALERMKLAQSGASVPSPIAETSAPALAPANVTACNAISAAAAPSKLAVIPQLESTGRYLGTELIKIGRTRFDSSWDRVSDRKLSRRDVRRAMGRTSRNRETLLKQVNSWVNRNIAYRDDRVQYGTSDYWADARTTLRSRRGDCEDYAILKMQMLAAAGVDREDMMLTLARDTIQRIDHAVLLVKNGDEWVMLDMGTNRIGSASQDYGYRAVMSFAGDESYLHGKKYQPQRNPLERRVRFASR